MRALRLLDTGFSFVLAKKNSDRRECAFCTEGTTICSTSWATCATSPGSLISCSIFRSSLADGYGPALLPSPACGAVASRFPPRSDIAVLLRKLHATTCRAWRPYRCRPSGGSQQWAPTTMFVPCNTDAIPSARLRWSSVVPRLSVRCKGTNEEPHKTMNGIYRYGSPFNDDSSGHEYIDAAPGHTKQPPEAVPYPGSLSRYSRQEIARIADSIILYARCWLLR